MPVIPEHLILGDARHGVNRYARALASTLAAPAAPRGPAHVHFTDRLWGATPQAAGERFARLAAERPVTVTLHDLPQPAEGRARFDRRRSAYRAVAHAAQGVVLSSRHERALLHAHVGVDISATVIPHFVAPSPAGDVESDGTVAILGYVYPGKGHLELLHAVSALPGPPRTVALGGPSPGHEQDVEALHREAARRGVELEVTGYLPDARLARRLQSAAVPVAAHSRMSASGSIATWIGAGRRPLVPDHPYTRELESLRPGSVTVYAPDRLTAAIAGALAHPETTRLPPGASLRPDVRDVAALYATWWTGVSW